MGLDMYLYAEQYTSNRAYFTEDSPDRFDKLVQVVEAEEFALGYPSADTPETPLGSVEVTVQIGYWRKANAVHKWFVDNVQGGVDECQKSFVPRERLLALHDLCANLLAQREEGQAVGVAASHLPPQAGFFFGSTEIDEYYWYDIEDTKKQLARALTIPQEWSIYYRSSW